MLEFEQDPTDYNPPTADIVCDKCGLDDSFSSYAGFQGCVDAAKADGWLIRMEKGEYVHYCSFECAGEVIDLSAEEAEKMFTPVKLGETK